MTRTTALHACLLGGILLLGTANADPWNKKTYITTSRAIEVPGAVLPPGKYVFKLLDSSANRHIVQIMNDRENHVYATNLAIPAQRMEPADKTVLTFYEMPGGGPEPVHKWFYPGDTFGQEFAYPKKRALEISRATGQNVSVLAELNPRTAESTRIEEPAPAPVASSVNTSANNENTADRMVADSEATAVAPSPEPAPVANADMAADQAQPPRVSISTEPAMPHTAGDTAALALAGIACLGLAATLFKSAGTASSRS